jgi:hypothetical protein
MHDDQNKQSEEKAGSKRNEIIKQRIIRLIIYIIVGFAAAFIWHQMKSH